jgi:hypothetical protein
MAARNSESVQETINDNDIDAEQLPPPEERRNDGRKRKVAATDIVSEDRNDDSTSVAKKSREHSEVWKFFEKYT